MQFVVVVLVALLLVTSVGHPLIEFAVAAVLTGVLGGLLHWWWSNRDDGASDSGRQIPPVAQIPVSTVPVKKRAA